MAKAYQPNGMKAIVRCNSNNNHSPAMLKSDDDVKPEGCNIVLLVQ